jgi:hypothetical protein
MRFLATLIGCCILSTTLAIAQNWKQVHKADEAKWAKATGLDSFIVRKLWRGASNVTDDSDSDSRIANLDLEGLAVRHDVLLVTYAGEKNCLTVTVFRQLTETQFKKEWSVEQPPDGTGFCDTEFGSAAAEATDGVIAVSVARAMKNGLPMYSVYAYDWNGVTYHFAGQKEVQGK